MRKASVRPCKTNKVTAARLVFPLPPPPPGAFGGGSMVGRRSLVVSDKTQKYLYQSHAYYVIHCFPYGSNMLKIFMLQMVRSVSKLYMQKILLYTFVGHEYMFKCLYVYRSRYSVEHTLVGNFSVEFHQIFSTITTITTTTREREAQHGESVH